MKNARAACLAACLGASGAAGASPGGGATHLCEPDESVRFACTMARTGKRVSLCEGSGPLVYRFGAPGRIELRLPDANAPVPPHLFQERLGSSQTRGVAFARGAYTYVVTHFLGGRPVIEERAISVQRDGSPIALLKCAARPEPVGDLPALFEGLRAAGTRVVVPGAN